VVRPGIVRYGLGVNVSHKSSQGNPEYVELHFDGKPIHRGGHTGKQRKRNNRIRI
jgi:hypothetical protein